MVVVRTDLRERWLNSLTSQCKPLTSQDDTSPEIWVGEYWGSPGALGRCDSPSLNAQSRIGNRAKISCANS